MVIHVTFNDSHFVEEIVKKVRSFLRVTHHQFMQMWKNKKKVGLQLYFLAYDLSHIENENKNFSFFFSFLSLVKFNIQ